MHLSQLIKNLSAAWISLLLTGQAALSAHTLTVKITGIDTAAGEIGCSVFLEGEEFPMGKSEQVPAQWKQADINGVIFIFENLEVGQYAVAVSHDLNGNQKTDTNFLGIPKEAWGVSQNVRPRLRAPRFDEAAVQVEGDLTIEIKID